MHTYTKEELVEAVQQSLSYAQVFKYLNLSVSGSSYKYLKENIKKYKIDVSHFKKGNASKNRSNKKTWQQILIIETNGRRTKHSILKRGLIEYGREYKCESCGNDGQWNGKSITLHIDHINQNWQDNRPKNLRFLCPNCHSQTDQCKKNRKHNTAGAKYKCIKCESNVWKKGTYCRPCTIERQNRIQWPNKEELEKLVWKKPTSQLAEEFGVSDKAVEKWCKKYNIKKPTRGYWQKQHN